jgi:hypothetical protein
VDWLRDPRLRDEPRTGDELARMAVARLHWQDTTAALRRFKQLELLRVVLRDVDAPVPEVPGTGPGPAAELTAIAEACLVAALRAELRRRADELGLASPDELPVSLTIVGMGTLAGARADYASDLDVVFVHEVREGADDAAATALALTIAANVITSLSASPPTAARSTSTRTCVRRVAAVHCHAPSRPTLRTGNAGPSPGSSRRCCGSAASRVTVTSGGASSVLPPSTRYGRTSTMSDARRRDA